MLSCALQAVAGEGVKNGSGPPSKCRTPRLKPGLVAGRVPLSPGQPALQPFAGPEGWWPASGNAGWLDGTGLGVHGRPSMGDPQLARTVFP